MSAPVIYTDGSYSPAHDTGTWVALVMVHGSHVIYSGIERGTTHNRMELMAIIKGIEALQQSGLHYSSITIVTDSQYAAGLPGRSGRLLAAGLKTRSGDAIRNADLVDLLLQYIAILPLQFEKVKAHAGKTSSVNYNREVDKLARSLLRSTVAGG